MNNEHLEEEVSIPSSIYQNNVTKANENKSSAISLIVIGVIGAVFVALSWFGKLPFAIGGSKNLMSHSVLFVFFVLFVILGIVSALSVKKYKDLALTEDETKEKLLSYLKETFTKEILEEIVEESDEETYFKRMNYMRTYLSENLIQENIDETFIESMLDDYYDTLFG